MSKFRNKSYELLQRLPAFRYTKPPVDTVAELYERYPNGVERSTVAFVNEKNTWYVYQTEGSLKGQWIPVAIDGASIPGVDLALVATTGQAKDLLGLAVVGLTGRYIDLIGRPVGGLPIVSDVTKMFTTNSTARFSARMTGHEDGKRVIELFGEDTSGSSNDLVITPALGFGPDNSKPKNIREYATDADTTPTDYKVTVIAETADGQSGSLTVQNGCPEFYFKYFVGVTQTDPTDPQPAGESYWVDASGTYHNFSATDTPVTNLKNSGSTGGFSINGSFIGSGEIVEMVFGKDYLSTTSLPDAFLREAYTMKKLDLTPFSNVVEIGDYVLHDAGLRSMDLRPLANVKTIGVEFATDCAILESVQIGSMDFSAITVSQDGDGGFYGITGAKIYADNIGIANAFIEKFPNTQTWAIVLNS